MKAMNVWRVLAFRLRYRSTRHRVPEKSSMPVHSIRCIETALCRVGKLVTPPLDSVVLLLQVRISIACTWKATGTTVQDGDVAWDLGGLSRFLLTSIDRFGFAADEIPTPERSSA